jgi:hypothetical protein
MEKGLVLRGCVLDYWLNPVVLGAVGVVVLLVARVLGSYK